MRDGRAACWVRGDAAYVGRAGDPAGRDVTGLAGDRQAGGDAWRAGRASGDGQGGADGDGGWSRDRVRASKRQGAR